MSYGPVLLASAATAAAVMLGAWLISVAIRDASIVDVAWALGTVLIAWVAFTVADGSAARGALIVALTSVWGLRLGAYLAWRRVREEGEDFRYRELRDRYGRRFPLASLFVVFGLQGLGMWAVSLPVQAGQVPATPTGLTALDFAGAALWAVGITFESAADLQLARFRADPENRGKVMDRGLWRYSRHPNYFGEFCVWWGLFLIAVAAGAPWWTVAGPLTISFVLLRMFGVPVMDEHMRRRPGYEDYVRRTSGFLPRPPRPVSSQRRRSSSEA